MVIEVIQGKKRITSKMASDLELVFSLPASLWLNLESNYRKALTRLENP